MWIHWESSITAFVYLYNKVQSTLHSSDPISYPNHNLDLHSPVDHAQELPVIAVDMDEVLCQYNQAFADFYNENYHTNVTLKDFNSYDYTDFLGGTYDLINERVGIFHTSHQFLNDMLVVPGAFEALQILKQHYTLKIVTARTETLRPATESFIQKHYPSIFSDILYANHYMTPEEKTRYVEKSKRQICREIGARFLIDDALTNAMDAAAHGMQVFLFDLEGKYGWNKLPNEAALPANMTRVMGWNDIVDVMVYKNNAEPSTIRQNTATSSNTTAVNTTTTVIHYEEPMMKRRRRRVTY